MEGSVRPPQTRPSGAALRAVSSIPARARRPIEPSILLVGADPVLMPALGQALTRYGVQVETASVEKAVELAVVVAPDLIVLAGEAARSAPDGLLPRLSAAPVSSVIPVVLLSDDTTFDARLNAFRHGAGAVIPRSASVDAMAERIAQLAREMPERQGELLGEIGEATLAEFVSTLEQELRSGILSVKQGSEDEAVRLVFGSGRPLAAFVDEFVTRVRRHVVHAEPLRYEFDDRAGGTVAWLPAAENAANPARASIAKLRVLLADDDPARSDQVAQALRQSGALVSVTSLTPSDQELHRLRTADPEVLLLGEQQLQGAGYALLQKLKRDTRLRWASLLVVRWEAVLGAEWNAQAIDRLKVPLAEFGEAERGLGDRAALGDAFDARIETCGPARTLRALSQNQRPLRVSVHNQRLQVTLDLAEGLIAGATANTEGRRFEGAAALAALLVISSGRVHVEPALQPSTTTIMSPVETALGLAELEPAQIAPSMPAAAPPPPPEDVSQLELPNVPRAARLPREHLEQPKAPKKKPKWSRVGVSAPVTALLVALAVLQGFLIVAVVRWAAHRHEPAKVAATAKKPAAPRALVTRMPVDIPDPPPKPNDAAPNVIAHSSQAATADISSAPTCDSLLVGVPRRDSPGLAYDELKRARHALVLGQSQQAELAYCKAALWDPDNASYQFELAQLLLILKDGKAAAEWTRKGLAIDPANARGQALLGDALARTGDTKAARVAWLAAAGMQDPSPQQVASLTERNLKEGEQAAKRRDYARAERSFRRAALLSPERADGYRGWALAQLRLGEAQEALPIARRASELGAQDPLNQLALGDVASALGDVAGARAAWQSALKLGYPAARRRLARLKE